MRFLTRSRVWYDLVPIVKTSPGHTSTRRIWAGSLSVVFATLPLFSAIHLAQEIHVYSPEHRHFHEVAIEWKNGQGHDPLNDRDPVRGASEGQVDETPGDLLVYEIECLLANVLQRSNLVSTIRSPSQRSDLVVCLETWQDTSEPFAQSIIAVAPKQSPPSV